MSPYLPPNSVFFRGVVHRWRGAPLVVDGGASDAVPAFAVGRIPKPGVVSIQLHQAGGAAFSGPGLLGILQGVDEEDREGRARGDRDCDDTPVG